MFSHVVGATERDKFTTFYFRCGLYVFAVGTARNACILIGGGESYEQVSNKPERVDIPDACVVGTERDRVSVKCIGPD